MIKLGDFGLAERIEQCSKKQRNSCETLWYNAPEVFNRKAELKSDVWSLGVSLMELAQGKNPYDGLSERKTMKEICFGVTPSLSSSEWSDSFVDFVSKCLVRDVKERASVDELMNVTSCEWV